MKIRSLGLCLLAVVWCGIAHSATLDVSGGILLGADNVQVGSAQYSVRFVGGTCADVFGICDDPFFTFHTLSDANAAAQALFDQVFIDVPAGAFNTNPSLTLGCGHAGIQCIVDTPYSTLITLPGGVNVAIALNTTAVVDLTILDSFLPYTFSTNNGLADEVWALWTPAPITSAVPEPETYVMLLTGLGLLGFTTRRRKQKAA